MIHEMTHFVVSVLRRPNTCDSIEPNTINCKKQLNWPVIQDSPQTQRNQNNYSLVHTMHMQVSKHLLCKNHKSSRKASYLDELNKNVLTIRYNSSVFALLLFTGYLCLEVLYYLLFIRF